MVVKNAYFYYKLIVYCAILGLLLSSQLVSSSVIDHMITREVTRKVSELFIRG